MLINTYIEIESLYSGKKKLQHVEMYVETKPNTGEIFYKILGSYISERFAILITPDREKATITLLDIYQELIDKQLQEAAERQKESA